MCFILHYIIFFTHTQFYWACAFLNFGRKLKKGEQVTSAFGASNQIRFMLIDYKTSMQIIYNIFILF